MPQSRNLNTIPANDLEIVIVDDDQIIRLLHQHSLKESKLDLPIRCFKNGREALHYFLKKGNTGKKYLVLLDINMPIMNGWEFLQECQGQDFVDSMHTVMVTSSVNDKDRQRACDFPQVIDYKEKPFRKSTVEELKKIQKLQMFFRHSNGNGSCCKIPTVS